MVYKIPLFDLNFDEAEEEAVLQVLRSRWISMGPKTAELERAFAQHVGARHAVAVSSCTAALHLALASLGIGPGDEVIVPSLTFVATVNAVRYVNATPVFADITSTDDFSIDPHHVEQLITPRTRAILPMHYAGFACDMRALTTLTEKHNLMMVEDAAHAPASQYEGRALGTFGEAGCFSFFSNKNMTCAEGGMLVTDRDDVAERVRLMRSHGMTTLSFDRAKGHATEYDVIALGHNYRLDDVRAAIALVQLSKLADDTTRRAELYDSYVGRLSWVEGVDIPYSSQLRASSHYIMPILIKGAATRRDAVRAKLHEVGIQTSVHYPAVHRFSVYRHIPAELPNTEYVADHQVTLPLYSAMEEQDVSQVTKALSEVNAATLHTESADVNLRRRTKSLADSLK